MDVQYLQQLENGHSVELGVATWDNGTGYRSVRKRYPTATGGFSPHSSSEVPISDLVPMQKLGVLHALSMRRLLAAYAEANKRR